VLNTIPSVSKTIPSVSKTLTSVLKTLTSVLKTLTSVLDLEGCSGGLVLPRLQPDHLSLRHPRFRLRNHEPAVSGRMVPRCARELEPILHVGPFEADTAVKKSLQITADLEVSAPNLRTMSPTARWSTTLSSKVNLPPAIYFRALCGANLVT